MDNEMIKEKAESGQAYWSPSIKNLAAAYAEARGEIRGALKDSTNPHFNNKFADIESVITCIDEVFPKHGLSFLQPSVMHQGKSCISTLVLHSSGEWIMSGPYPVVADKPGPQAHGAGTTYARRYALSAMLGIKQKDDDAENAEDRNHNTRTEERSVSAGIAPNCCGRKMMVSKYHDDTWYCITCKKPRPMHGEHHTTNRDLLSESEEESLRHLEAIASGTSL